MKPAPQRSALIVAFENFLDDAARAVANALPARIVYWCVKRVAAHAPKGEDWRLVVVGALANFRRAHGMKPRG